MSLIDRLFNFGYTGSVPTALGDRYYSQDLVRDAIYNLHRSGMVVKDIYSAFPVFVSGGLVTKGTGDTLNVTLAIGYAQRDITVPDSFASFPPTYKTVQAVTRIEASAQTNMALASATLNGVATNYVKLVYAETNGATRTKAKLAGSYAYEVIPGYAYVVDTVAPTDYDVCLASFVGTSGGAFTIVQYGKTLPSSSDLVAGSSMKFERSYTQISKTNPWFCMSLADQNWTTAHFSADFIATMRTRKVIYDEMGTSPVSSFGGAWAGDTFTLTNNAANVAMITALAREYLYAGSPTTNWRLLNDGTNEFNIIAISVSARTIKVNLDSKTATGSAIEIYRHRVYGSTTSARHFSEAGLGFYQSGGDKISGLRRADQMQGHEHQNFWFNTAGTAGYFSPSTYRDTNGSSGFAASATKLPVNNGADGDPRIGTKTEIEAGTLLAYIYVGSYTA